VLFITRKYPPATGGMERFAYDLSQALAAKTDLTLIKWSGEGRLKAVLIALPYLFVKSFFALLRNRIDVIHVQDGMLAPLGWLLGRLFRKPYVVGVNGLETTYQQPLYLSVVPPAIRAAGAVICISQATAEAAEKHLKVASSKIHALPLAVRDEIYGQSSRRALVQQLRLNPDSQIILSVGRLVRRKGVAWFVANVLPGLAERYPKLIYLVVGEGEDRSAMEAAIRRRGLAKHVRLLGKAPLELLRAAYNGADVFVMPNIRVPGDMEGFGLVLHEAALCGLPVVATALEGIKDAIIDGKNGVLVSPGQAAQLAAQISSFLDDTKYARRFGLRARRYTLQHYQWPLIAEQYLAIYQQLALVAPNPLS